jgi:hypothetical protein
MVAPVTSTDIVNQAINMMGGNTQPITGVSPNFDSSAAGQAAASLYIPCVKTVARQFSWDFSHYGPTALIPTGNPASILWAYEYYYPADCVQVRQVMPNALTDIFNPLPILWEISNNVMAGLTIKTIQTNFANAQVTYSNYPPENTWDSLFREAVVRLLSSELAVALAGRPDTARDNLSSGAEFIQIGESRDG